jgi:tetratricopeptide (TPR) repeat protein
MDKKKLAAASNSPGGGKPKQIPPAATGKPSTKQTPRTVSTTTAAAARCSAYVSGTQNFILFWLDSNITEGDDESRNTSAQLQSVIKNIHLFNDVDECTNYLNKIKEEQVLMVVSGRLGQQILPRIHNMQQLLAVFVYCGNKSDHESWTKSWHKIKGISTDITHLCESLKQSVRQYDDTSVDISLIPASDIAGQSLDQLDQSYMYTQLMKEILLELEYDDESLQDLVKCARDRYFNDEIELKRIRKVENEYTRHTPIWWYTYECFLYHMLNEALRSQQVDVIIRMGFYIRDLHQHIERLRKEQSKQFQKEFTVYRGQGMLVEKFEETKKTKGGLISFNNFLSTSTEAEAAMVFAASALEKRTNVGILFIITINPLVPSAPFANLANISDYKKEKEILFSMHTVFRIDDIKPSKTDRLWFVYLTLTSNNDQQLNRLSERLREEIKGSSALYRLGALMIKLGEFKKAQEAYETLLKRTVDDLERGNIYYQLGQIMDNQANYNKALEYYQHALTIYQQKLKPDHPNIATCYNNIGLAYDNAEDYQEALPYYEKALEIYRKTLRDNHPNIATTSNSIGLIYNTMGDYAKALSCCKSALEIFETELSEIHPLAATSHNNIGLVYANMKKYPEAAASYKHAVDIGQKVLPANHPNLLKYKHNLASVSKKGNK